MTYKLDPFQRILSVVSYSAVPDKTLMNEGENVTFNITAPVPNNTVLYWKLVSVSGNITDSDFTYPTAPVSAGDSVTITDNISAVYVYVKNDLTTEGPETFRLELRTGSPTGTLVATSANVTITDTSVGDSSIGVPGIPDGGTGTLGAQDCRWNTTGTSVAWAHRINSASSGTCVSVYDFSGGALTKVADIVTAKFGISLDWANNTTLAVFATGTTEVDRGLTVWTRSGNTFTKTYQNTAASPSVTTTTKLRYCSYGIQLGGTLYNNDTTVRKGIGGNNVAWYSNIAVCGAIGNSSTTNPIQVYSYNNATNTLTAETPFVPPKYDQLNSTTLYYPSINDLKFNGSTLLLGVQTTGYNPAALVYQRNGANSWSLLYEVPSDPEQSTKTGSAWGALSIDWKNSSEYAIGRFIYSDSPSGVYRYSGASVTQKIASTGGQFYGIDYHPSQNYIAAAAYNNKPYFRVYPF